MCGIGGVVHFKNKTVNAEELDRVSLSMRDRGPDDSGVFISGSVGLVHRRLSIIDLNEIGKCPMDNEDGTIQVVFNGEIYNHQKLRKQLLDLGHHFKSNSDTEAIIHGYEEWGNKVVNHLDGMFAFAIWDDLEKCIIVARDRMGEKPLYYFKNANCFVFASSLIALHAYFTDSLTIDHAGLDCYLSHSFIPASHTIWNSIKCFPHAHLGRCEINGNFTIERYWDFPDKPSYIIDVGEAEYLIESDLKRSIKPRLFADVPLGGFLSGGVDSSLVMALAARQRYNIDTFSIGFQEAEFSELSYAQDVATAIGSKHHELIVKEDDLLDILPELIWQLGQPFADPSIVPTYMLSRFARETVKVCLSGDGGDESFAGYWRYAAGWYTHLYRKLLPIAIRKKIVPRFIERFNRSRLQNIANRLKAMNTLSLAPSGAGYTNAQSWLNVRNEIIGKNYKKTKIFHDPRYCRVGKLWDSQYKSVLRQMAYDDFQVLLPDAYLAKVDVASMGASLEVRTPMLDHHFVESAWLSPDNMKLRFGERKWLLKRIAAKYVPHSAVYRKKMGFAMPLKYWWRGRLAKILTVLMIDSRIVAHGWIEEDPVKKALAAHLSGKESNESKLWSILCLELWARIVDEGTMPRSASLRDL